MEVPGMDEVKKPNDHIISPAAFVEGGIQDSCDDACSICLEVFCDSDPSTVTSCKHEFHLHCILEWCQRSSNCPMCWQTVSMRDPGSQELLEAVEQERNLRFTPSRNATIYHHITLGDFDLQHLNNPELEDRIIQHLAAIGRSGRASRRESSRSRSSNQTRQRFVVFSANPDASSTERAETETSPSLPVMSPSFQGNQISRSHVGESSMPYPGETGPSEFQTFSDTWRSRLNTMSMRYKESISRNTKEWKEKLFSRSSSMADIGSEVRREVSGGIASVSRMMERLETRDNNRAGLDDVIGSSVPGPSTNDNRDTRNPSNSSNTDVI